MKIFIVTVLLLFAGGCYTQLMTPQEFVQSQRKSSMRTIVDNSYSINYNQSCVTCHSTAELDERSEELELYGISTVHNGILLSSRPWRNVVNRDIPIDVSDPYWHNPHVPVAPWWLPPASTPIVPSSTQTSGGGRIRESGTTRDSDSERDRSIPTTYSQPQTPVGGSTSQTSTPPAQSATVASPQPSTPPTQTNESERSRESSSGTSSRTRSDGSSRDDSGNRPR